MSELRAIELLSPAKNLECGIAAVDHGADAVYIGASRFSARASAGNSVEDIKALIQYAHRFRVKVYVAINTILTDEQIPEAVKLIYEVYEAGADSVIIQDMGLLQASLPPIAIHASTQTDNRTVEKVRFLKDAGFSRVVLARELTLKQIQHIADKTSAELEVFVHGALCVSFSGQCYISQAMCGRSANRGECAQYCRLPYDLFDGDGNQLEKSRHLLSLKDLDLSESLQELLDAGVISLKIEGRLKDVDYVKNITAYYRRKLDAILDAPGSKYCRASSGTTRLFFEPDPGKSFRRPATDYFLHGRHPEIHYPDTPKSLGEYAGRVIRAGRDFIDTDSVLAFNNADGICFIDAGGVLKGFSVNTTGPGGRIYPNQMPAIEPGMKLYRNQDHAFGKLLKGKTAERKIKISLFLQETPEGFSLRLTDEDFVTITADFSFAKQEAKNNEGVEEFVRRQLAKLGTTIFEAGHIGLKLTKAWFLPVSALNEWRRTAVELLEEARLRNYRRELPAERHRSDFPVKKLSYLGNVTNTYARNFYLSHGVEEVMPGFEIKGEESAVLMFTKHCIKYEMGWCPREGKTMPVAEPLTIAHGKQQFRLGFDCRNCEMHVLKV